MHTSSSVYNPGWNAERLKALIRQHVPARGCFEDQEPKYLREDGARCAIGACLDDATAKRLRYSSSTVRTIIESGFLPLAALPFSDPHYNARLQAQHDASYGCNDVPTRLCEWIDDESRAIERALSAPPRCNRCGDESNSARGLPCGRVDKPGSKPCLGTYR